jgi:hypothetical protein
MSAMRKLPALLMGVCLGMACSEALPEDTDIFTGLSAGNEQNINVLIILDNTANWSRQAQHWPDDNATQGQSEVRAIKQVINTFNSTSKVNVGMELINRYGGGYIRYNINPMNNATNRANFSAILDRIYANINDPDEKVPQSNPWGDLWWDAYNYLSGLAQSAGGATPPVGFPDPAAYTTQWSLFRSPLDSGDTCAKTVIIFIGNSGTASAAGRADSAANGTALTGIGGTSSPELDMPDFTQGTTTNFGNLGYTSQCYTDVNSCSPTADNPVCVGVPNSTYDVCQCNAADTTTALPACASGTFRFNVQATGTVTVIDSDTFTTTNGASLGSTFCQKVDPNPLSCPTTTTTTQANTPGVGQTTTTTTSWSSCKYAKGAGCGGQKFNWTPQGNKTVETKVTHQNVGTNNLGNTFGCSTTAATCNTSTFAQCSQPGITCACTGAGSSGGSCAAGTARFQVQSGINVTTAVPDGTYSAATPGQVYTDEWAKALHQIGVNAPAAGGGTALRSVTTYTIDVFHDQQDNVTTSLLLNAANVGGGKYFQATNYNQLVAALSSIFAEIQSINSAFASASLPVSATARTQDKNQVFIGMFRPDPDANPQWFGNVKQFKVVKNAASGQIELGDSTGKTAINSQTGFITDCAISFWTTDESPPYWANVASNPPARGRCTTVGTSAFADYPDGPLVEKGATAEVVRKGNNPPTTDTSPTYALNRVVKTLDSGNAMVDFNATNVPSLPATTVDFMLGHDVNDEDNDGDLTETRPSLHGDVVHSRPLAIDYGNPTGTIVYYGANDGSLRSVTANTGKENWAFIAPEFYTRFQRLKNNSPQINYPNMPAGIIPAPIPKDYFFDGLIGVFQKADNSKIWIYPSMRRGGRMLYAFDVSPVSGNPPTAPIFKWKFGCPNLADNTGCASGATSIGQGWAFPNVAFVKGYSTTTPVVILGGGYDACEDANSTAPSCGSTTGNAIFIFDADTGALLKSFATDRAVPADVALIDIDLDGRVDYAYVADTGGNIYRIDFIDGPATKNALAKASWAIHKVAFTNGGGRKFLFKPALLQASASLVYVAIGSGDREHPLSSQYPYTTPVVNRFYVFKDDLTKFVAGDTTSTPTNMDDTSAMVDETSTNACNTLTTLLPSSSQKGWFLSLNEHGVGEQVVTSALIEAGFVDFSTNRPIPPNSASCATPLGEARGYKLNLFSGSGVIGVTGVCGGDRSTVFAGGGLPPSPVLATVPLDDGSLVTVAIGTAAKNSDCIPSPLSPCKVTLPIASRRRPVYWFKSSGDN